MWSSFYVICESNVTVEIVTISIEIILLNRNLKGIVQNFITKEPHPHVSKNIELVFYCYEIYYTIFKVHERLQMTNMKSYHNNNVFILMRNNYNSENVH